MQVTDIGGGSAWVSKDIVVQAIDLGQCVWELRYKGNLLGDQLFYMRIPFMGWCAGANKKTTPPGSQKSFTFSPNAFKSVQCSAYV